MTIKVRSNCALELNVFSQRQFQTIYFTLSLLNKHDDLIVCTTP